MKLTLSTLLTALVFAGCTPYTLSSSVSTTSMSSSSPSAPLPAQVKRVELAPALYELVYSPQQQAVFVASSGGRDSDALTPKIYRLHPDTLVVEAEIDLDHPGLGLALDEAAQRLYVGNAFDAAVTVIDIQSNQVIDVVSLAKKTKAIGFDGEPTERYPHNLRELVVDSANQRLFAPGIWIDNSALYIMSTDRLILEKMIPDFGFGASGVALDEVRGKLYVSNLQGQLYTLDAKTLEVEAKTEVQADQLLNMIFDKKTHRLLAVDQGGGNVDSVRKNLAKLDYQKRGEGNRVVVINPADGSIEKSIPTGTGPVNLALDEVRNRLIVTNRGSGTVTVYDRSQDDALVHTIKLPDHPNTPKVDSATGTIFVTVKNNDKAPKYEKESVARITLP